MIQRFLSLLKQGSLSPVAWLLALLCLIGYGWLSWQCFDTQIVGFMHDDGVYVATAKALAESRGYILPHLPGEPAQVKYPIVYSLLLAGVWKLFPRFPENMHWMQSLTTTFALASLPLLYAYLRRIKDLPVLVAWLITLLTGLNFHFMFYATSLMSEAPYFFLSLLTLALAESTIGKANTTEQPGNLKTCGWPMIGIILLSALAFHTRTVGITLIGAITAFLLLKKQWKAAITYTGITCLLTVLPWLVWVKTQAPETITALNHPIAYVYGGYGLEYQINSPQDLVHWLHAVFYRGLEPLISSLNLLLFPMTPVLVRKNPAALMAINLIILGLMLVGVVYRARREQYSVSGLYVVFYVTLISIWFYPNQAMRFLAVLLPWLWLALYQFWVLAQSKIPKHARWMQLGQTTLVVALLGWLSLWPASQGWQLLRHLRQSHQLDPSRSNASLWEDYRATFRYIQQHTPANTIVGGIWDPTFYLHANRQGFPLFTSAWQRIDGKITVESFRRLYASLQHYGVEYVLMEPLILNHQVKSSTNPVVVSLQKLHPEAFRPVFQSPHGHLVLYRIQFAATKQEGI